MLTGFNTDAKYRDTVYHVQTEDKGVENPLILSLIYVKGTILDAFRTRYQEYLESGSFSEAGLQKILECQHRQIVAAIKRGKYQKGMALEPYVDGAFVFEFQAEASSRTTTESGPAEPAQQVAGPVNHPAPPEPTQPVKPSTEVPKPPSPQRSPAPVAPEVGSIRTPLKLFQQSIAEVPSPEAIRHTSIDIATLSGEEGIEICVEGAKDFVGGELVDLHLYVQSRQSRLRIENVQIVIKIIGTTFSPRLYAGKTDRSGSLRMNFSLPTFSGGSAALIVQASTAIGNYEVKYLVKRRK